MFNVKIKTNYSLHGKPSSCSKIKCFCLVLDWSLIDAQVASSMKDIDEDPDEELTAEDETDLLVCN